MGRWVQSHAEKLVPTLSTKRKKKKLINRVGSCPYHKCLTGRGVCFMATRAPPQSRNQTLYSSSKIWNNNNNNNNHSNASHLHRACYKVFHIHCFLQVLRLPTTLPGSLASTIILTQQIRKWTCREQITLPSSLQRNFQGSFHQYCVQCVIQCATRRRDNKMHAQLGNPKENMT